MILTISGLPKHFNYHDAKAMIKQEAHITNFILDNLVLDSSGKKKVTVGLEDSADVPLLMNRLNGFLLLDHCLTVSSQHRGQVAREAVPTYAPRDREPPRAPLAPAYGFQPSRREVPKRVDAMPSPYSREAPSSGLAYRAPAQAPFASLDPVRAGAPYERAAAGSGYGGRFPDEELRRPHAPHAPAAPAARGLLKTPAANEFPGKTPRYPTERSPPRRASPRRSPPRYIPGPDKSKFGAPSATRPIPPFVTTQAAPSGFISRTYPIGAEEIYHSPPVQASSSSSSIPPWQQRGSQPAPGPFNQALAPFSGPASGSRVMGRPPVREDSVKEPRDERDRRSPFRRRSSSSPPGERGGAPDWRQSAQSPPRRPQYSRSPTNDRRAISRERRASPLRGNNVPRGRRSPSPRRNSPPPRRTDTWVSNEPHRSSLQVESRPPFGTRKEPQLNAPSARSDFPQKSTPLLNTPSAAAGSWRDSLVPRLPVSTKYEEPPLEDSNRFYDKSTLDTRPKAMGKLENSRSFYGYRDGPRDMSPSRSGTRDAEFHKPELSMSGPDKKPTGPGPRDYGPRDAAPREFRPHNFGPQDSKTRDSSLHQPVPRDCSPRTSAPHDFVPRDSGRRDLNPSERGQLGFGSHDLGPNAFDARGSGQRDFGPYHPGPREFGAREPGPRDFGPRHPGPQDFGPRVSRPRDFGLRQPGPHEVGPRISRPRDFGPRQPGPQEAAPRDSGLRDFGPRHLRPQELGPRDSGPRDVDSHHIGPQKFSPCDSRPRDFGPRYPGPQEFGPPDSGARDFDPRHAGPQEISPRDYRPRDFDPSHPGPQEFSPRDSGPSDFEPHHSGLREYGSRSTESRDIGLRHSRPRAFSPRDAGPKDFGTRDSGLKDSRPRDAGPRHFSPRNSGPRDLGPRNSGSRDLGPRGSAGRDSGHRNSRPDVSGSQDFRPHERSHDRFAPRDRTPRSLSYERPGPSNDQREGFKRGDRSSSRHRVKNRPNDREQSLELETRDNVVAKISHQITGRLRPDLIDNERFLQDLAKLLMDRVDSIFGSDCGHKFGDIARGYRKIYPAFTDTALLDELLRPTNRKRSAEGPSGPPTKQRHIENKPENRPATPHRAGVPVPPKKSEPGKMNYSAARKVVKSEFGNQSQYTLPTALRRALDEELEIIMDLIRYGTRITAPTKMDKDIIRAVRRKSGQNLLELIDMSATKRILNIRTDLFVRVIGIPKMPSTAVIDEFLSQYKATAMKKSDTSKTFVAMLPDHYEYDRLCQLGSVMLDGQTVKFKPMHSAGPKRSSVKPPPGDAATGGARSSGAAKKKGGEDSADPGLLDDAIVPDEVRGSDGEIKNDTDWDNFEDY